MESMMPILYFVGGMVSGVILFMIFQRKNESSSQSRADEMQRAHEAQIETLQKSQAAQLEALRTHQGEQIAALKESQAQQIETLTASQQQQTRALKEEFERERKQMQENQAQQIETLTASQQEQTRALKEEFEHERKRLQERMAKQEEDMRRENVAQFKALASEILTVQTAGLKQTNTEQLKAVLGPLAENIESFRKAVNDSYVQESASRKSLSDQIDRLMRLNETIGTDAKNLTSALRGNSKVQGDWGEMILETMLENAGLEEGIHFTSQATRQADGTMLRDEQGALQRPDVIVSMPDSRKLIIDSKVSLTAFVDLCAARDEHERRDCVRRNLESVRRHIDELAAKRYQDTVQGSADHVLMFIPNEGAYIAAIQADGNLWQYAYERNVAIVSPTHLFSVMKIVSQLWVQDKQNRNTLEIARRGGKLYEKVVGYVSALQDVGAALKKATDCYDTAFSRLYQGRGNVVKLAQDLKDLGAKTAKSLPQTLLDDSTQED